MCTLLFSSEALGEGTCSLAANRDEDPSRPWTPPAPRPAGDLTVLCPEDHRGGTWVGTNGSLLAAVTNLASDGPPGERSRGLLVRDVLAAGDLGEAGELVERGIDAVAYDGFNLLVASPGEARIWTWDGADLEVADLGPGIHLLRHRVAGGSVPLEEPARRAVAEELDHGDPEASLRRLAGSLLTSHAEGELPGGPTCRHGARFATTSSTLIHLDASRPSRSRFLFADGPPCGTRYRRHPVPDA